MKKEKQTIDELIEEFCSYLRSLERSEFTIAAYVRVWQKVKAFMNLYNYKFYDKSIGEAYLKHVFGEFKYPQLSRYRQGCVNMVEALHEFQEAESVVTGKRIPSKSFSGIIGEAMSIYINYRHSTFNLSEHTIDSYKLYLHELLLFFKREGVNSLNEITLPDILLFIQSIGPNKLATMQSAVNIIKSFCLYLYNKGLLAEDYSNSFPKVNYKKTPRLPSTFSTEEISTLLNSVDRANPRGKRDYAILLMAIKLGMRASDIVSLKFENIQWEQSLITFNQIKTGKPIAFPLLPEIGNAIIDYLKYGRPVSDESYCFLKLQTPYKRLHRKQLSHVVLWNLTRAGICVKNRRHGPHALRHSFAGTLLSDKTPLPVISEALGHANTQSTMTYLRIDVTTLKQCTLDVPLLPSSFYHKGGVRHE